MIMAKPISGLRVAHALLRAASAIVPTLAFEFGVPLARMLLVAKCSRMKKLSDIAHFACRLHNRVNAFSDLHAMVNLIQLFSASSAAGS